MLYNYLRIYFRSLLKNRFTGCINIAVLAICFTCTLVMSAIVVDDLAFDRHFSQEERIYRVLSNKVANGVERRSALTPASLAFDLSGQTPDVEVATRIMAPDEGFLFKDGYAHKQSIVYTDSAFLKIFNLRLLVGSVERALEKRGSMLLSESAATALYGKHWLDADVVGKQLFLDDRIPFTITGVFSDLDKLSHFRISLLATVPSELSAWMNGSSEVYTYLLRAEHAKSDLMREKVRNFDSPVQEDFSALAFDIQKLRDVHLTSDLEDEMADTDELSNLYSMCILIALIAFIAATNYASLYAANVLDRLKEVGVRKSIGATSSNVRSQFVFEVATTAIIALVISVIVLTSIACSGGICHSPV